MTQDLRLLRHALINVRWAFTLQAQPSGRTTCDALKDVLKDADDYQDYQDFAQIWTLQQPWPTDLPSYLDRPYLARRWGVNILVPGFYHIPFKPDEPCQKATDLRIELLDAAIIHFTKLIGEER